MFACAIQAQGGGYALTWEVIKDPNRGVKYDGPDSAGICPSGSSTGNPGRGASGHIFDLFDLDS
jgi:hypothetical protein